MLTFPLTGVRSVLCLGAHADDIEIGCGGSLLALAAGRRDLRVTWAVLSASGPRIEEARRSAKRLLRGQDNVSIAVESFRDGFFPSEFQALKEYFEGLKELGSPDLIFTHHLQDRHQDHHVVGSLTWNTFRRHTILEYEVPKYDGGLETPNVFVPLPAQLRRRKVRHLMSAFGSQTSRGWYDEATFNGLMRLRGVECASPTGYAEGFHCRKMLLTP